MNLKSCEKKENSMAEIIIEVESGEFKEALNESYKKNRGYITVPGFRKGKAPRKIIENMYGNSIFYDDALEFILPGIISFVRDKETELRLASFPRVTDVNIKEDESADITLSAALHPEVKVSEYKGLRAPKPMFGIVDNEIDKELEDIRVRNARIETADRPAQEGDTTLIDFEGFVDGEPFEGGKGMGYELTIGSNAFIPGFEEKMIGMSAGEERDIDLQFPENYHGHLAGKDVVFKVKLHEVKINILPEIDDEFAKDVSEFDTLEDFKNSIKEDIVRKKQEESDIAFENELMNQIVESMEVDLPEAMIEDRMDQSMRELSQQVSAYGMNSEMYLQMMGLTAEAFASNMRASSEKQLKAWLALEKIAELENIEISDEDVEDEYIEAAKRLNTDVDRIKMNLSREMVVSDIKCRRASKLVVDNAVVDKLPPIQKTDTDTNPD